MGYREGDNTSRVPILRTGVDSAMPGLLVRLVPYLLAFFSSLCIMVLELVASRLVAQHIGASLIVWTSVIGVILAGICLGNVLGGRLADRIDPRLALGPLYAVGAALTLGALWLNALVGYMPFPEAFPWNLRTLVVVTVDFLVPATVLGMISPVVAKIAVGQAKRSGSAIGDVYFWGAVGSIVGTYLAGFWLLNIAPVSTIVSLVAAALSLLAAALLSSPLDRVLGLAAAVLLGLGSLESINHMLATPGLEIVVGNVKINLFAGTGHLLVLLLAIRGLAAGRQAIRFTPPQRDLELDLGLTPAPKTERTRLGDLATLAFIASLAFMSLEMIAGRLVARHLGSSIYGWTSVIGVLLGGLSLGNFLGGKLADHIKTEKRASTLFLIASALVLFVLLTETPPKWLVRNPIGYLFQGEAPQPLAGGPDEFLHQAISMTGYPWWLRVLWWTGIVYLVPAISMGTVSPIVAKLAVERTRKSATGSAIGSVYAWGMVGSLVGTFLTGFLLIDVLGTKGVLLALATLLALAATGLGSIFHAAWAGIPLGLCVIAFLPPLIPARSPVDDKPSKLWETKSYLTNLAVGMGLREKPSEPDTVDGQIAYIDESNYYYIKVSNEKREDHLKRTLVLDNLIHGYFILGQPEVLDYDYEHIYALVTHRLMQEKAERANADSPQGAELGTLFIGGGSYTFPRYLQATYPKTWAEVAEIDPAVTRANHIALGLPWPDTGLPQPRISEKGNRELLPMGGRLIDLGPAGSPESLAAHVDALGDLVPDYHKDPATGKAVVVLDGEPKLLGEFGSEASRRAYIEQVNAWYTSSKYRIRTTWGDARQYVAQHQNKKFDVVYGDAFNDFSVPWHLTTHEFNAMLGNMLTPEGVYMINIIDVFESDAHAAASGPIRELRAILDRKLRPKWAGSRPADRMARDVAGFLVEPKREPGLAAAWGRLGAEAAILDPGERLPRAQIARRLGSAFTAQRLPDGPATLGLAFIGDTVGDLTTNESIALSIGAVLANARSDEVIDAIDEARQGVIHRSESKRIHDVTANSVLTALSSIRSEAFPLITHIQRTKAISNTIQRAIDTADFLARSPHGGLGEAAEQARDLLVKDYSDKSQTALSVKTSFDLMDAVKHADELLKIELKGDEDKAEREAIKIAGQIAVELRRVQHDLAVRLVEIHKQAEGDEAIAKAAMPEVARFLHDPTLWIAASAEAVEKAREMGGFLGAWVNTARKTFPNIYVFGTASSSGLGDRETFVVVASRKPLDVAGMGHRPDDPVFFVGARQSQPEPYGPADMSALELRSRGIVLTDDYAPVENLLARVADTRGLD
jgi:MFS family permease